MSRFRIQPLDLRAALETLAAGVQGLRVVLRLPPDLAVADPARAETLVRCVQEVITNALRHARAREPSSSCAAKAATSASRRRTMGAAAGRSRQRIVGNA